MAHRDTSPVLPLVVVFGVLVFACGGGSADFVIEAVVAGSVPPPWSFTASGGAVDSGDICPEGVYNETMFDATGAVFLLQSELRCGDGSGTLVLRAEYDPEEVEPWEPLTGRGTWTVVSGTGDYAGLETSGDYTLSFYQNLGINIYEGNLDSRP